MKATRRAASDPGPRRAGADTRVVLELVAELEAHVPEGRPRYVLTRLRNVALAGIMRRYRIHAKKPTRSRPPAQQVVLRAVRKLDASDRAGKVKRRQLNKLVQGLTPYGWSTVDRALKALETELPRRWRK